ncbi:hypothetical protein Q9966_015577 [Columba livia]|nr:hypothetical protein Q9966_015577 [Columba livia]
MPTDKEVSCSSSCPQIGHSLGQNTLQSTWVTPSVQERLQDHHKGPQEGSGCPRSTNSEAAAEAECPAPAPQGATADDAALWDTAQRIVSEAVRRAVAQIMAAGQEPEEQQDLAQHMDLQDENSKEGCQGGDTIHSTWINPSVQEHLQDAPAGPQEGSGLTSTDTEAAAEAERPAPAQHSPTEDDVDLSDIVEYIVSEAVRRAEAEIQGPGQQPVEQQDLAQCTDVPVAAAAPAGLEAIEAHLAGEDEGQANTAPLVPAAKEEEENTDAYCRQGQCRTGVLNRHVPCGLICHPDREHILYPLGCTVLIQHLDTKKQSFLHGHADNVSCVVVSRDGMYVASGQVTCIGLKMTDDDGDFHLGTTSGDVLKVNTSSKVLTACGPQKKKLSMGVTALLLPKTGGLIVGTGEGTVALCTGSDCQVKKRMRVEGAVTSLTCRGRDDQFFLGTNKGQMHRSAYATFKEELVAVCHTEAVNDIVFPEGHSDLFVTCSTNDIRVRYTPERLERLRIAVPNVTRHAVEVTRNGMVIVSGDAWNDGKIRAFVPATGEPMYEINNAHNLGVTAIAATSDCKQIISGGGDGQVRIWNIGEKTQKLREVLKEHRGAVSCIKTNKNDKEGVTASLDGTCVIWDLERYVRKQMILDNTLFKCVCYHRGEYQIITSGTDRKIVYWEVLDGSAIREVQGSLSSSINGMDITSDGVSFVTGECVVGAGERRSY